MTTADHLERELIDLAGRMDGMESKMRRVLKSDIDVDVTREEFTRLADAVRDLTKAVQQIRRHQIEMGETILAMMEE